MKYLFISSILFLTACSNSGNDCDCTEQRWERTVEYQGTTETVVATTGWNANGMANAIGSTDCSLNESVASSGVESTVILPSGNTRNLEFEYRVTCY